MTEIGERLKAARLEKGLSLDDLQNLTKIQKRYLAGIEEGNYSSMPGKFYVRAFMKQYAEAVGLEPEELFEEYKSDVPNTFNDDLPEKLSRVQTRNSIPRGTSKFFDVIPVLLMILFVIGAAVLIYIYIINNNSTDTSLPQDNGNSDEQTTYENTSGGGNNNEDEDNNNDENDAAQNTDETDNTDGSGETGSNDDNTNEENPVEEMQQEITVVSTNGKNTTYALKQTDRFILKLVSTGATWVNITNGAGNSFFQGTITNGNSQTVDLSAETEAKIVVGRTTETEMYINDQKVEFAVSPSEHVDQNITIQFEKTVQ
ncbi:helix-turn-helix domain-containing protein [Bacillaceae bacterium Marseille-Q3522]|nr:helix-turn-helix domain-containing protein [Bacillaceae bacterium Marseille-Q3522]